MIKAVKRVSDRMLAKFVPATDAHACATVCVEKVIDGRYCYCASPCQKTCSF
ncbi:hypothetical protein [Phytomonospora endophytica]|uniref:Uncharacterized protein n=1 Tax=Phytomonospora endophytica TaxID=714109 RepID=A0A841FP25_9ACTN|nr:hypothetical protein [Phytomonospora endophytica]MBB6033700.1 hypothetical protein [Phytomonospora endophytica]GIG64783.1 hypothetical protein Pen01_10780 [Phytomonospora endophytica]